MNDIEEFSDDRQKAWCVHCGAVIANTEANWNHVPSKSLLVRPLPPHVPQVEICRDCNSGFSLDEEYFITFLSYVLSGTTDTSGQVNSKVQRALERNPTLRTPIEAGKKSYTSINGEEQAFWEPEIARVHRIAVKNARGHAFYEFGEPMLRDPDHVIAMPLASLDNEQRSNFEAVGMNVWPEVGSRMMTRNATGQDMENGWVVVQKGIYRYAVFQAGTMMVRSVIRDYLATEVYWE